MTPYLVLYGLFALFTAGIGWIGMSSWSRDERRKGARIVLGSAVWPALWLYGLWLGIRSVIKEADL